MPNFSTLLFVGDVNGNPAEWDESSPRARCFFEVKIHFFSFVKLPFPSRHLYFKSKMILRLDVMILYCTPLNTALSHPKTTEPVSNRHNNFPAHLCVVMGADFPDPMFFMKSKPEGHNPHKCHAQGHCIVQRLGLEAKYTLRALRTSLY